MKKNNIVITLIIIIIISIVLFVVYNKKTKIKTSLTETESKIVVNSIKDNLYKDINNAKKGKYKDYLYCDKVNCKKIDNFNIKEVKYVETLLNGNTVYQINYTWSCKDKESCIYNEQYIENNVSPYYEVDKSNKIINYLGNIFEQDFNIIKSNMNDAVDKIKNGESVSFLPYTSLEQFDIKTIDYVKTLDNSHFIYKISYKYKEEDKDLVEEYSYFEVTNTFEIVKNIGKNI